MSLHEELKSVSTERLLEVTREFYLSLDQHPESQQFDEYLLERYPALAKFAGRLGQQLYGIGPEGPGPDESVIHFVFGAVTAYSMLSRHAELEALGE